MKFIRIEYIILLILFTQCHSTQWNTLNNQGEMAQAPDEIRTIFSAYPDNVMSLQALSPGYSYKYDIGEKDSLYSKDSLNMRFKTVEIKLADQMPQQKVLANFKFIDESENFVTIRNVDLLRLTPKMEGPDELIYSELLLKEYNRFGYAFRKEHNEFELTLSGQSSSEYSEAISRAYRCNVVNNCLAPGKWEFTLNSEDYSDFRNRLTSSENLNQNRILAHSWFQLDLDLYKALLELKNPGRKMNIMIPSDSLSLLGEQAEVDFDKLRKPLKNRLNTNLLEIGHQSGRRIEPLDVEQFYKREFGLILEGNTQTYSTILEKPVKLTQFREEGFYRESDPLKYDFGWMKHMDTVVVDVIDVKGTEAYVQISLTGKWSPYKLVLGNIDMAQLSEQKLMGFLFGINTYPKGRRYNPVQSTIVYDPDLLPDELKPYLLLADNKTGKWVNNQYKGIEKVYVSYESLERDVLEIYVLSYERITPVWMARVELPRQFRERVRIRKNLYDY